MRCRMIIISFALLYVFSAMAVNAGLYQGEKRFRGDRDGAYLSRLSMLLENGGKWERLVIAYGKEIQQETTVNELSTARVPSEKTNLSRRIGIVKKGYPYRKLPVEKRVEKLLELALLYERFGGKENAVTVLNTVGQISVSDPSLKLRIAAHACYLDHHRLALKTTQQLMSSGEQVTGAALVAGYSMIRSGKPGPAALYFETAYGSVRGKSPVTRYTIQEILGYLYADMDEPEKALRFWSACLKKNNDSLLSLRSAEMSFVNGDTAGAEHLLLVVDTKKLNRKESSEYYSLKAALSETGGDAAAAEGYYTKAIEQKESVAMWCRYSDNLLEQGKDDEAYRAMQHAVELAPDNVELRTELGFLCHKTGRYYQAQIEFGKAREQRPEDCRLLEAIGNAELAGGEREKSIATLERALECRNKQQVRYDDGSMDRVGDLKRSISLLEKQWSVGFTECFRIDDGDENFGKHIVKNGSYNGYGTLEAAYVPEKLTFERGRYLQVFGRFLWDNKIQGVWPVSGSLQGGFGVRYKPHADYGIFLSGERLTKLGGKSRNDWMIKASASDTTGLDWGASAEKWNYRNIQADSAYLFKHGNIYLTVNGELGKSYRLRKLPVDAAVTPYVLAGARYDTDNPDESSELHFDLGAGVSLFTKHSELKYLRSDIHNRMTLEGRFKAGGDSDDENTITLKVEVSF